MKILQIVGARPQFVKLAPFSRIARTQHQEVIVHSGQHYDTEMNEVFFQELGIPSPHYHLGAGSSHDLGQIAHILTGLEPLLTHEAPDIVIVYGDTNTTLAGALAAVRCGFPVAHVEAGLRSFNTLMPEETNRVLTDHMADILFMPTQTAMENAKAEGLESKSHLVGDIMVDSLLLGQELAKGLDTPVLGMQDEPYWLLTLHRPYNVDDQAGLVHILDSLNSLNHRIFFPVHPRTRRIISGHDPARWARITMLEPQSYTRFLSMMSLAQMIITDSGGIQKEAYVLRKPCITLRTETEWPETVETGWNLLLPPDSHGFPLAIQAFEVPHIHPDLYGSNVAQKMLSILEDWYQGKAGQ